MPPITKHESQPLLVRYDPRDLSKLYVKAPDHSYLEVPYADIRLPPLSLWELRAARRFLAQRGRREALAREQSLATTGSPSSVSPIDYTKTPRDLPTETWGPKRRS